MNTPDKDIKFKTGMTFRNKKDFKQTVLSNFMPTDRPYKYLHADLKRSQVRCASRCPFKIWTSDIKDKDVWPAVEVISELTQLCMELQK